MTPEPLLTRRRLNERFESWGIYFGDVMVGRLTENHGLGSSMIWRWTCGFYPGCGPHQQSAGSEDHFGCAKAAFQIAWERLQPQITPAMMHDWLDHQDWTAKKYALWDAGKNLPHFEWSSGKPAEEFMKCPCGEVFDMRANNAVVAHVPHITASK